MAPLLALDRIGKTFGALQVIDAFTASVDAGEILGVVGPNGAPGTSGSTASTSHAPDPKSAAAWESRARIRSLNRFER
jgi:ABC-type branched-subunit amino acid transport system ATPase component